MKRDFQSAPISAKLKALLVIAGKVQRGGKNVTSGDVEQARRQGATDEEIHDTVLIAAAFCMYSCYVDGLATAASDDPEFYPRIDHSPRPVGSQATATRGINAL